MGLGKITKKVQQCHTNNVLAQKKYCRPKHCSAKKHCKRGSTPKSFVCYFLAFINNLMYFTGAEP